MSEFLEGYGTTDARRERKRNRIIVVLIAVAIVGAVLYFTFRDFREERQLKQFVENLRAKNYDAAYVQWGCSKEQPCRDYQFEKFMEDWGPASAAGKADAIELVSKRSCSTSVLQTLKLANGEEVVLLINRADLTIGFSPWPVCTPRMKISGGA